MRPGGIRWLAGRPEVRRAVDGWRAGALAGDVLRDNPRRRLVRLPESGAGDLLVKQFRVGSGRHPLRERLKARIGRSPAAREYRALEALRHRGVAVPEPLALGELPEGDRLLVMAFLPGVDLREVLGAPRAVRDRSLAALGEQVRRLHRAGFVHGDLHGENLIFTRDGPFLLDLQHARRRRSARARIRDLGDLDYSLWGRAGRADRLRIRAAALGVLRPFAARDRSQIARVAAAAQRRAAEHGRSRTRRALRPGRLAARLDLPGWRGLRVPELDDAAVGAALTAHATSLASGGPAVLADSSRSRVTAVDVDGRAAIVKESPPRGLARALADAGRGSAGWRAWRGGQGLLARGIGAARPLAYGERRHAGVPVASFVLLERLPGPDALEAAAREPASTLEALGRLLDRLHDRGVDHGDLKATHVLLGPGPHPQPRLVDLEGVRFPRRLREVRRIQALAELNASLPDAVPAPLRTAAFRRYAARHPFRAGADATLREVVRRSLGRRHRWSGAGCEAARPPRADRS